MIVIGEKINGTVNAVKVALQERDAEYIGELAFSQAEAGADYIDVNVGTGTGGSEAGQMAWALGVIRSRTDRPPSLDSSDPVVLETGLELCGDSKPFINSVSGEISRMEVVLPLAARYGCPLVALAMDESGIPKTPGERLEVCKRIIGRARELDIPEQDVFFDPLVLPVGTDHTQARITLETLEMIRKEIPGARTILGLSNVSFGLPNRSLLNCALLAMAISIGLDAALMDPTDRGLRAMVFAAEAVAGHDAFCSKYLKAYRNFSLG